MRRRTIFLGAFLGIGTLLPASGCYDACEEMTTRFCPAEGTASLSEPITGDLSRVKDGDIQVVSASGPTAFFSLQSPQMGGGPFVNVQVEVKGDPAPGEITLPSSRVLVMGFLGSKTPGVLSATGAIHVARWTDQAFVATWEIVLTDNEGHRVALSGDVSRGECQQMPFCSRSA